jgi:hypothetical protein
MRRVPSRTAVRLAEEETAQRIAQGDVWTPVLRPAPERWLWVTLVVDDSVSMAVWTKTAQELRGLLQWTGAFRDLRLLRLNADGDRPLLHRAAGRPVPGLGPAGPGGRHLVLVLSDCVARAWWTGQVFAELEAWSRSATVGLVQALPEPMWSRTALGRARVVRLRRRGPGSAHGGLEAAPLDPWLEPPAGAGFRLPVAGLEPDSLGAMARLVAGGSAGWAPGLVVAPGGGAAPPDAAARDIVPEERAARFKRSASPTALRLAGLVAVSPVVSLQVIRLIRQALLPQARQVHEAEFLLGGLLHVRRPGAEEAGANDIYYRFYPGVADLLLDAVPVPDWIEVLSRVSEHVERHLGIDLSGFRAVLADPTSASGEMEVSAEPFLRVAAARLRRLGGDYARWVQRREQAAAAPRRAAAAVPAGGPAQLGDREEPAVQSTPASRPEGPPEAAGQLARDEVFWRSLPMPLREIYQRAITARNPVDRHMRALALAEAGLRLAASARLGVALAVGLEPDSALARSLRGARRPTLGHWVGFLREATFYLQARPDAERLPLAGTHEELLEARALPAVEACLGRAFRAELAPLLEGEVEITRLGVLGFFNSLVAYRNRLAEGPQQPLAYHEELGPLLLEATREVLRQRCLFGGLILSVLPSPSGPERAVWKALEGLSPRLLTKAEVGPEPELVSVGPGEPYFVGPRVRVPLDPLVVLRESSRDVPRVAFLDGVRSRERGERPTPQGQRWEYLDLGTGERFGNVGVPGVLFSPLAQVLGLAHRKVFPSFSQHDSEVVSLFERHGRTVGEAYHLDYAIDRTVEYLPSKAIQEADIFQLFWSKAAAESTWVRMNWEHALSLERPDFIRAVYWEEPMPPPPPELAHIPFVYHDLATLMQPGLVQAREVSQQARVTERRPPLPTPRQAEAPPQTVRPPAPAGPATRCAFLAVGLPGSGQTMWMVMACRQILEKRYNLRTGAGLQLPSTGRSQELLALAADILKRRVLPRPTVADPAAPPFTFYARGRYGWSGLWRKWEVGVEVLALNDRLRFAKSGSFSLGDVRGCLLFLDPTRPAEELARLSRGATAIEVLWGVTAGLKAAGLLGTPAAVCIPKIDLVVNPRSARSKLNIGVDQVLRFYRDLEASASSKGGLTLEQLKLRSRWTESLMEAVWPTWEFRRGLRELLGPEFLFFPMTSVGLGEPGEPDIRKRTIAPFGTLEPLLWLLHKCGYPVLG